MRLFITVTLLLAWTGMSISQTESPECPGEWVSHDQFCYLFQSTPTRRWRDARYFCQKVGAYLLSVDSTREHDFIVARLSQYNTSLNWFTSGEMVNQDNLNPVFNWMHKKGQPDGIRADIPANLWLNPAAMTTDTGPFITYTYISRSPALIPIDQKEPPDWYFVRRQEINRLGFVCEILKTDTALITSKPRDFAFGVADPHPDRLERGPFFVREPQSTKFFPLAGFEYADVNIILDCEAGGLPQPSYSWFKATTKGPEGLDVLSSEQYTLTNGRLTIHQPNINRDRGNFFCEATSKFGKIRSQIASIKSESLLDFAQENREIGSTQWNPKAFACLHNNPDSEVQYTWFKGSEEVFINTQNSPHIFMSQDGNIYFSAVLSSDSGRYGCSVTLASGGRGSRRSPWYNMRVSTQPQKSVKPTIPGPFPAFFPKTILRGMDVLLECYALGTVNGNERFNYRWHRPDGKSLEDNPNYFFTDWNRKLIIKDIKLEDAGRFVCTVTYDGATAVKGITIAMQAMPFFESGGLENQFIDDGRDFIWACNAEGDPIPTYRWLKDAQPLMPSDTLSFSSDNREIRFTKIGPENEGMYQCEATNSVGIQYSTAQLKVLRFAPSFAKFPLVGDVITAVDGNATIPCDPEAAPKATITWLKDGAPFAVSQTSSPVRLLSNGYLYFSVIQRGTHEGVYTCRADNGIGAAEVSTRLIVKSRTLIRISPVSRDYPENSTIQLPCVADYDRMFDIKYIWMHNDQAIDFEDWRLQNWFARDVGASRGGLVIRNATYEQRGRYTCIARTISDEAKRTADIGIYGRPGEPAGVEAMNPTKHSVSLNWVAGASHGRPVLAYLVERYNLDSKTWVFSKLVENLADVQNSQTVVTDLFSNTAYTFRVRSRNVFGYGPFSRQSNAVRTEPDKPTVVPDDIGGGGGREGDLNITWTPLPKEKWNGPDVHYQVWYKESNSLSLEYKKSQNISQENAGRWVTQFHVDMFYTPYEVKVIAFNKQGQGPEGDPVIVYSAEGIPQTTPEETVLNQYNATALEIAWNKPSYSRDKYRGKLLGYRATYWKDGVEESLRDLNQFRATFLGDVESGLIIGLEAGVDYQARIQMFNSAGDGTPGRVMDQTTFFPAPQQAPEYVGVDYMSNSNSFRVSWRGISTTTEEEPLDGYMIRIWKQGEHVSTATDYDAGRDTEYIVEDIPRDESTIYNLRVFGYSRGGVGKLSSPMIQFVVGCDAPQLTPEAQWVYLCNGAPTQLSPSHLLLITLSIVSLLTLR